MRIAVIHHNNDLNNDYGAYLSTLLDESASDVGYEIKEHFLIKLRKEKISAKNTVIHFLVPSENPITLQYWYKLKLPKLIKHYGIERAISLKGMPVSSEVAQFLVIPDSAFINEKSQPFRQLKKVLSDKNPANISLVTYSTSVKEQLLTTLSLSSDKIWTVPYSAPAVFHPREWHDKLYLKSKYSENKEYFLSFLNEDDLDTFLLLLKSFSVFKKWQNSSMKLIILPREDSFSTKLKEKLSTYKYRDDIVLVDEAERREIAEMVSSAYALVYFPTRDSDLWTITVSMISAVPVISSNTKSAVEYVGTGGILIEDVDSKVIGRKLIEVYKDEQARTKMADEAEEKSVEYLQKNVAPVLLKTLGILQ